jgi:arylamine N-acetyltransferase
MQLTVSTISHHTPHCKTKLDDSTLSFACFTWLLELSHKNRFLPTNMKPQHWSMDCFFDSPLRALRCRRHIHYSWRNRHPTSHFYTVQAVCQSWNQSRVKHVKSVFGPLQSNYTTNINECTWEGNNERINTHIFLSVLIVQAYYA